ncbi:MAG: PadR family transcriptional regulator [Candidatus Dormibacteraeota bacterium]|nr:PadR family transcriptional regulator [Candidatus Dormibacteraeota bacterium]
MYLDILVLSHLAHRPAHGYEIKKRVDQSLGSPRLNNNVLYPALRRFEEAGAIKGELVPQQGVPPRRVFQLTESGHELLRSLLEDFPEDLADSDEEFLTRLAFFHLVDPQVRLDILGRRRQALRRRIDHLDAIAGLAADGEQPYAQGLLDFQRRQAESELGWVGEIAADEARRIDEGS